MNRAVSGRVSDRDVQNKIAGRTILVVCTMSSRYCQTVVFASALV